MFDRVNSITPDLVRLLVPALMLEKDALPPVRFATRVIEAGANAPAPDNVAPGFKINPADIEVDVLLLVSIAPFATVTEEDELIAPTVPMIKVPEFTIVWPVNVLVPLMVRMPMPIFTRDLLPPDCPTAARIKVGFPTLKVAFPVKVVAPNAML